MRLIYFTPRGVLQLLEDITAGQNPSEQQISTILPSFNDHELLVHRSLGWLDPTDGASSGNLTLRAERTLREISAGKRDLRQKVKVLLNEALTIGPPVSPKDAAALRDEILAMNRAIEEAEEALVIAIR